MVDRFLISRTGGAWQWRCNGTENYDKGLGKVTTFLPGQMFLVTLSLTRLHKVVTLRSYEVTAPTLDFSLKWAKAGTTEISDILNRIYRA